ncbi:MAG: hypothetical protein HYU42_17020, partial [Candidatus Rokubacteria bacterium]|nr:hypothetical protein [Candidatus Rokubacteria bacterium]
QNDILKEFIARGTYIFPPAPSLRLVTDIIEYCAGALPRWNFINVCGYHMREAGSTLVQEVAFALADACTYVQAAVDRGLAVDNFAPRFAFNFTAGTDIFREAAKFRAMRRLWARLMRERFGARKPDSWKFRTGAGSGASQLTAQQPENNIVRVTLNSLAAILGGVQSLHTAAYDEALALPTEKSVSLALRTQQVLAYEAGVTETVDPLAGSYYVESLTGEIEARATALMGQIEREGGMVRAIDSGWVHAQIAEAAWAYQQRVEAGTEVVVGVNRFVEEAPPPSFALHRHAEGFEAEQAAALKSLRETRDSARVRRALPPAPAGPGPPPPAPCRADPRGPHGRTPQRNSLDAAPHPSPRRSRRPAPPLAPWTPSMTLAGTPPRPRDPTPPRAPCPRPRSGAGWLRAKGSRGVPRSPSLPCPVAAGGCWGIRPGLSGEDRNRLHRYATWIVWIPTNSDSSFGSPSSRSISTTS